MSSSLIALNTMHEPVTSNCIPTIYISFLNSRYIYTILETAQWNFQNIGLCQFIADELLIVPHFKVKSRFLNIPRRPCMIWSLITFLISSLITLSFSHSAPALPASFPFFKHTMYILYLQSFPCYFFSTRKSLPLTSSWLTSLSNLCIKCQLLDELFFSRPI